MARSVECKCEFNFTCGYCLRNAKPWFYTLSDGSAIYETPLQGSTDSEADERSEA
jgi:hypothetical protein